MEQCINCKYLNVFGSGCAAYPENIPEQFANNTEAHNKVEPDQIGDYVFEQADPDDMPI